MVVFWRLNFLHKWIGVPCETISSSHAPTHCSSYKYFYKFSISSIQFSCSVVSDSLRPHESQHARPPCPSPTLHSDAYIFALLLCFLLLFFSQLFVRPPQTAIVLFFSMGMVLIPVSCTMSRTSFHSSSGTPSIRSGPLNLFLTSTA